jgi:chemotaxis signal transduction protein
MQGAQPMMARRTMSLRVAATDRDAMHVVARVGAERFAFRVADAEEVIDCPDLIPVPNAPAGLAGQFEHRGRTVSAFDAGWMFDVAREQGAETALVLRVADDRLALLVDDVEDLTALDTDAVRPTPAGADPAGLLRGVCLPRAERARSTDRRGRDRRRAEITLLVPTAGDRRQGERRVALICIVNTVAVVARATADIARVTPSTGSRGGVA